MTTLTRPDFLRRVGKAVGDALNSERTAIYGDDVHVDSEDHERFGELIAAALLAQGFAIYHAESNTQVREVEGAVKA